MSSTNPLATLSSLIDTSTPHLALLHQKLDLPANALKEDLGRLEAILRRELESLVEGREKEVREWNGKVKRVEQGKFRGRSEYLDSSRRKQDRGRAFRKGEGLYWQRRTLMLCPL
jgi:hypothetical protein